MTNYRGDNFDKNESEDFLKAAKAVQKAIEDDHRYLDDAEGLAKLIKQQLPYYQCYERQIMNAARGAN